MSGQGEVGRALGWMRKNDLALVLALTLEKNPQLVGLQFLHLLNSGGRLCELCGFTPFQAPNE